MNIMVVGVGGQGTLLTSRIIGNVALKAGYDVKLSEVPEEFDLLRQKAEEK